MVGYTLVNLRRVEDQAPRGGLAPGLEARFARTALALRESGLSYFRLAPGYRMPFGHRHERQEEVYVLVSGAARAKLDDQLVELEPWDALRIDPATVRCLEAGADGAEVIAFGAPNTDNRDVQPLPGWWTDEEGP